MEPSQSSQSKPSKGLWTVITAVVGAVVVASTMVVLFAQGAGRGEPGQQGSAEDQARPDTAADCEVAELDEEEPVMSPSGQYRAIPGDPVELWHDGETSEISDESANDLYVNSSGDVVGSRGPYGPGDSGTPWVYRDGEITDLPLPDEAEDVHVGAMGEDGTIAGVVDTSTTAEDEETDGERILVVWDPDTLEPSLGDDSLDEAEIVAVTDDGDVLGNKAREPWKWDSDGEGEALPAVPERDIDDGDLDEDMELHNYDGALYDGEVIDVSGDWTLAKSRGNDYFRWNGDGDPQELELDSAGAIDAAGRVYGNTDRDVAAIEDDEGDLAQLPGPDGDYYEIVVVDSDRDGDTSIGRVTDEADARYFTWTCQ